MRLRNVPYRKLAAALRRAGFSVARQKGSHVRFVHPDGRSTTVPHHAGEPIGPGVLRRILEDARLDREALERRL